jgi:hypothetical protein
LALLALSVVPTFATGPAGRTLLYVKGGAAWLDEQIDIATNNVFAVAPTGLDGVRWGWTAGAGVERALTPAWSLLLEYDYAKFCDVGMATPTSSAQVIPPSFSGFVPTAGGTTNVGQSPQTVQAGPELQTGRRPSCTMAALGIRLSFAGNGGYAARSGRGNRGRWPCPCQGLLVRTECYGAFLQASYKIDGLK